MHSDYLEGWREREEGRKEGERGSKEEDRVEGVMVVGMEFLPLTAAACVATAAQASIACFCISW